MLRIDLEQFQKRLSFYMQKARQGEEIVIAQSDLPELMLSTYAVRKRQLGAWKNKVEMAEDFDIMPNELQKYFS